MCRALVRWDPLAELSELRTRLDRRLTTGPGSQGASARVRQRSMSSVRMTA